MARLTPKGWVSEAGRTPAEVDEAVRGLNARRSRPAKIITLSPEAWARLDEMARRRGSSRSATVELLVREAEMPRPRPAGQE
jgi:hypothetical protein